MGADLKVQWGEKLTKPREGCGAKLARAGRSKHTGGKKHGEREKKKEKKEKATGRNCSDLASRLGVKRGRWNVGNG